MSVGGKRIVVTGGARGIGAEAAAELRARGADVTTLDRLQGADLCCDVSDAAQVDAVFDEIATAGPLDGLLNNAALLPTRKPFDEIDLDEWDAVMAVNVRGTFLCARAAARHMPHGGSIVNLASETAFTGSRGFVHYVASKGAVVSLTRALANELGRRNIRVNCVAPGFTPTPGSSHLGQYDPSRTPLGRVMQPADLLGTFCYLLSDDSAFVSGQTTLVNGGRFPVLMAPALMFDDDYDDLDATALAELVRSGAVHPRQLVDAAIERVERRNPALNAVIHRQFARARADAERTDMSTPFPGVPFLLKDFKGREAGEPYHMGVPTLRALDYRPRTDSDYTLRVRAAGMIPIGRTNTPQLAVMGTTEPALYGPTHNPWAPGRSAGGSSGGSAAAVAARIVPVAHANDISGSIRIPAAMCGVVGLKPTRGRVVTSGVDPPVGMFVEGVVSRTVRDTAAMIEHLAQRSPWWPAPAWRRPLVEELSAELEPLRVGVWTKAFNGAPVDPESAATAVAAAQLLAAMGCAVEEDAPDVLSSDELWELAKTALAATTAAEAAAWTSRIGHSLGEDDLEPRTWAMVQAGQAIAAPELLATIERIQQLSATALDWFDRFDLLVTPTTPSPASPHGDYLRNYVSGLGSAFTRPINVTGQPAISLPLGWPPDGLPRGVQVIAGYGREDLLIRVAAVLEQASPWDTRRPQMVEVDG